MGQHSDGAALEQDGPNPYVKGLLDGVGLVCLLVLLVFAIGWLL